MGKKNLVRFNPGRVSGSVAATDPAFGPVATVFLSRQTNVQVYYRPARESRRTEVSEEASHASPKKQRTRSRGIAPAFAFVGEISRFGTFFQG